MVLRDGGFDTNGRRSKVQQRPTAIAEEDAEMRLGHGPNGVLLQVVNITHNSEPIYNSI